MRNSPKLRYDFILNEAERRACRLWLEEADAETVRHPLEDPHLEFERQRVKGLLAEYERNWQESLQKMARWNTQRTNPDE